MQYNMHSCTIDAALHISSTVHSIPAERQGHTHFPPPLLLPNGHSVADACPLLATSPAPRISPPWLLPHERKGCKRLNYILTRSCGVQCVVCIGLLHYMHYYYISVVFSQITPNYVILLSICSSSTKIDLINKRTEVIKCCAHNII